LRILLAAGLLLGSTYALGYRTTSTHSLPFGLYRSFEISPDTAQAGTVVLICLPAEVGRWARGRGYISEGSCPGLAEPVGKSIAAAGNRRLTIGPGPLRLEQRLLPHSHLLPQDSRGRPLPHPDFGSFQVPEDHVWLHAPHPRSLDSRVFGSVPRSNLRAVLRPVAVPGYPLDLGDLAVFLLTSTVACSLPFLAAFVDGRSRGT
jgi:conjugative transfer signal peptidase TraF